MAVAAHLRVELRFSQGRHLEVIDPLQPHIDPPPMSADLYRGLSHHALGNEAEAVQCLERFHRDFGGTLESWRTLGQIRMERGDKQAALDAFRQSLDDVADQVDTLTWFYECNPPGRPEKDVAERFAKLTAPANGFEQIAGACEAMDNLDILALVSKEMLRIDPKSAPAKLALAIAESGTQPMATAAKTFREALALEKDPMRREDAVLRFLLRTTKKGQTAEACEALDDEPLFFRVAVQQMLNGGGVGLRRMLLARAKKHPDDPVVQLFEAKRLADRGDDAEADKLFTAAVGKIDDENLRTHFDGDRIRVRYRLGKAESALDEIRPADRTLQELEYLCVNDKKHDLLDALIEHQLKKEPDSEDAHRRRMISRIRQGKFDEGIAEFKSQMAKIPPENQVDLTDEFLMAMVERKKSLLAYEAVADSHHAMRTLGFRLEEEGASKELEELIEAHRQKHGDTDAAVLYFTACKLEHDQAWSKAALAFRKATRAAGDRYRGESEERLIQCRYQAGQAIVALEEADPKTQAFVLLASLTIRDRNWPLLDRLIEAQEKRGPSPGARRGSVPGPRLCEGAGQGRRDSPQARPDSSRQRQRCAGHHPVGAMALLLRGHGGERPGDGGVRPGGRQARGVPRTRPACARSPRCAAAGPADRARGRRSEAGPVADLVSRASASSRRRLQ